MSEKTKAEKSLGAKSLRQQNHMRRYLNKNLVCEDLKLHRRHVKIHRPRKPSEGGVALQRTRVCSNAVSMNQSNTFTLLFEQGGMALRNT